MKNVNTPRELRAGHGGRHRPRRGGHKCVHCGGEFISERGVEVGHVFKLGTFFSETLNATFLSPEGSLLPAIMGCYGIGIGRLLAATIEHNRDERGMRLPVSVSPFQVYLAALNADNPEVMSAAGDVYRQLTEAGFETLYDDRTESAGVKFNDADLFGFPVRVVISPRNLREGKAEVKRRDADSAELVPLADTVAERGGAAVGVAPNEWHRASRPARAPDLASHDLAAARWGHACRGTGLPKGAEWNHRNTRSPEA